MFSSSTVMLSTRRAPSSAMPSSPETSFASTGLKPPRKTETPACSTSKLALECAASTVQVPVGISISVAWWSSEAPFVAGQLLY